MLLLPEPRGIDVFDGVHLDLNDQEGFVQSCEQGRDLGFDGKTLIHPKQVEAANKAFAPSEAELAEAEEIIAAWKEAQEQGQGVVLVNGKLVESLHVEEAERKLVIAEQLKARV